MLCDRILWSVAFGFAVIASSAARADDQFHCPPPGTVLTYSDGGSMTITGQIGLICQARNGRGPYDRLLGIASTGSSLAQNGGERLFPWRVGTEFEYDHSADASAHVGGSPPPGASPIVYYHDTVKVVRQEKLVTAAGTFDTFVIEQHEIIKNHDIQGAFLWSVWFAPDLGYCVKQTYEVRMGLGKNTAWEITSIKLPQAQPATTATEPTSPAVAPAGTGTSSGSATTAQRLQQLKDLLNRKLITRSEYETKRKAILGAM